MFDIHQIQFIIQMKLKFNKLHSIQNVFYFHSMLIHP